jgi:hypothetical protein
MPTIPIFFRRFLGAALLALALAAPVHACGDEGQPPCGGACNWIVKGTCPFCVPWCHRYYFCHSGYEIHKEGIFSTEVCRSVQPPPPPPPAPCDPHCQAERINAALGNPEQASNNRTTQISRNDAHLATTDYVHLDVGGESAHHFQSRCDGHDMVVNVNPNVTITGGPQSGQPIPNLVLAYAQHLPFQGGFADEVCAQAVPFNADWAEEMARVVKPGGKIAVCGVRDSSYRGGIDQLKAHGLNVSATNDFGLRAYETVLNVPPGFSYTRIPPPGHSECAASVPRARALRQAQAQQAQPAGCQLDVAILYTDTAARQVTAAGQDMAILIQARVAAMNTALANSGLGERIHLVHAGPTSYDESKDGKDMATTMGVLTGKRVPGSNKDARNSVWELRATVGADLVSVFTDETAKVGSVGGSACGIGDMSLTQDSGYSVLRWRCMSSSSSAMAHEMGHNLGLQHDRFTLGKGAGFDPNGYNYGYVSLAGSGFWTTMGYATQCATNNKNLCSLIPYYSSPALKYQGVAIGAANADNTRAIRENAPIVAAYKLPAAGRVLAPSAFDFESLQVGATSTRTFTLYNTQAADVQIANVTLTGDNAFQTAAGTTCVAGTLRARSACVVNVKLSAATEKQYAATLTITFSGGGAALSARLTGEGLANKPELYLSADYEPVTDTIDLGNGVVMETRGVDVKIANHGTAKLHITALAVSGDGTFRVDQDGVDGADACAGFPNDIRVPVRGECHVILSFKPTRTGSATATLTVTSNDPAMPVRAIALKGFGVHDEL